MGDEHNSGLEDDSFFDKKTTCRLSLQMIVERHLPPEASSWDYEEIISALNKITHVRLDRENIRQIDNLELFGSSVTNVYLQKNCIKKIENLSCLTNLVFLTLAGNKIKKLENLTGFSKLALLDLSDNQIEDFDVDEFPQSLVILNLSNNPCTNLPDHRGSIIQELPCLRQLNGEDVSREERLEAGYCVSSEEEEGSEDSDVGPATNTVPTNSHGRDNEPGSVKFMANEMLTRSQQRLEESLTLHKQRSEDMMNMRIKFRLPPVSARSEGQGSGEI
ncbi:leucine-rich repeat-containing protein 46-like [Liolophura sinensis]|uniref:leucine-rich repeat-containing protein 46-like n=1 Tax=Liolophura sinensis TaxID=3198878 RepID=UPI0031591309